MAKAKSYVITKADAKKYKDAGKTPAERRAISKALVTANSAANNIKKKGKA